MTTPAAVLRTDAGYLVTHVTAGHADPSDPHFDDFLTDLDTFVKNANRFRYAYHPPATIEERLSFLVLQSQLLEQLVSQAALDANAAVHTLQTDIAAAADRTATAIGDVAALTAARDAAVASQATAEANAAASAEAAATSEAARAQAAADLVTSNELVATTQAALDAALADAAADATTNADTTTTAQAASATATGIAVTPV